LSTIGNKAAAQHVSLQKQTITGNGGTSYTLQQSVGSSLDIAVFINNTRQEPVTAYSASGTALVMTGAVNASDHFYVLFLTKAITTTSLPVDVVGTSNLAADAVTQAKIAAGAIGTTELAGSIPDSKIAAMAATKLTGTVASARFPSGSVLQTVHNDDAQDRSLPNDNTTYILGCEASITPSSTSNKILIIAHGSADIASGHYRAITWALFRGSTGIFSNDFHMYDANEQNHNIATQPLMFLDSPSTTSATTYKCSAKHMTGSSFSGTYNGVLNRYHETSILLMEIAG